MTPKPARSRTRRTEPDTRPKRFFHLDESGGDWLDHLLKFDFHFGRFARDAVGVLLVALAAMVLLALLGGSDGIVLLFLADLFARWFGWGSYLLVLSIGFFGVVLLRWNRSAVSIDRIIAFELLLLLTLSLLAALSAVNGDALARAGTGQFGGLIGWGLAFFAWRVAGEVLGTVVLGLLWLLALMTTFGLWQVLEKWLSELAGEYPRLDTIPEPPVVHAPQTDKSTKITKTKVKPAPLPPEFRKSLPVPETQDNRPAEPTPRNEKLPDLSLLSAEKISRPDERTINQTAGMIEKTLSEFGIPATVIGFRVGPTVTQFAVQPGFIKKTGSKEEDAQQMKVRVAQIAALQKDLTLALSAQRLRIQAPVPGKPFVGIEVPNSHASVVRLRAILETDAFYKVKSPLAIALGRDVSGQPIVADLSRMPHLLIAGSTGSGKSVCITAIASCLAMNNSPEDLRLVMIDSKMVELLRFNGLSHLYGKVETKIDRIMGVLRWVVVEMEHRYRLLESAKARDLDTYNSKLTRKGEHTLVPRIVVIIDELADLMMSAPDQTEHNLVRLAQMARATGIHLVVATQRPSTDVVTGLIKANFPARLAFATASGIDSRVILDAAGAESLLGHGDMLFLNPEVGNPVRAQGVMVADQEIENIITYWQKVSDLPVDGTPPWEKLLQEPAEGGDDVLIEEAKSLIMASQHASASLLQRRLRIGYPRAARLLDQLEEMGLVGPSPGGGREREVLVDPETDLDQE